MIENEKSTGRLLASISVCGSVASLIGMAFVLVQQPLWTSMLGLLAFFVPTLALTAWVLLVPGNWLQRNAIAKLAYYSPKLTDDPEGIRICLRGVAKFPKGQTRLCIKFDPPFAEKPEKFRVLHDKNAPRVIDRPYCDEDHGVVVLREPSEFSGSFEWVAMGKPLYPVAVKPIRHRMKGQSHG